MSELKTGTWIVIADSEKALFLENVGDADFPHFQVLRKETQENPADHEQGTDRPGRFNDGPSVQRSAVAETDWHALAKERFADELAEILNARALKSDFDHLVIVASPTVLGMLRKHLHSETQKRVVAELPKNLTHEPLDRIEEHVREDLKNVA